MNRRTIFVAGTFVAACSTGVAHAQTESRPRTGQVAASPTTGTAKRPVRAGVIPLSPPAQPIVVNTTGLPVTNTTGTPIPNSTGLPPDPHAAASVVQLSYYPTVVLSDGRVLANFGTGRGYEQVLRRCPNIVGTLPPGAFVAPCWTVDAYGRYAVVQQR
jgi:hypothetical protein